MEAPVNLRVYDAPPIDRGEILRYAGCRLEAPEISALIEECLAEMRDALSYRVCFREFDIALTENVLHLGFADCRSSDLAKNLTGCNRIIVFAATVGIAPDRMVARYGALSPTKALLAQAIGAERIEALCDAFCQDIARERDALGERLCPRFSPGYGDLPLELQKKIVAALDCQRKIGLTVNESLLLSPTKSVTAIIGVKNK